MVGQIKNKLKTKPLLTSSFNKKEGKRVLVALSGGVDSAVAAYLLKKQGYQIETGHIICWDSGPYCSSDQDRSYAARVASYLNLPFKVFDFRKEYSQAVVDYFYSEYAGGRTPNPDVACNREIKFGLFLNKALSLGYDYIATGHYARVSFNRKSDQSELLAGKDPNKDQSYFLYTTTQDQLKHTLFPIGELNKKEVRKIASQIGLPNAERKDSQGICFIGNVQIREFLGNRFKKRIGKVIDHNGEVIGTHEGVNFYTVGQREGLAVSKKVPYYVVSKDRSNNTLVAAPFGNERHYQIETKIENLTWVGKSLSVEKEVDLRLRYRQELVKGRLTDLQDDRATIAFLEPQRAVTPGQALVIYENETVRGGGTIVDI